MNALPDGRSEVIFDSDFVAPTAKGNPEGLPELASEVALLTRNVVVQFSQDDIAHPNQSGAHLPFYHTSHHVQTLEGVEFRNVSQNSIVDSYFRCLIIADSHNMMINGNIGYKHKGHCFAIMHGSERDNTISFRSRPGHDHRPSRAYQRPRGRQWKNAEIRRSRGTPDREDSPLGTRGKGSSGSHGWNIAGLEASTTKEEEERGQSLLWDLSWKAKKEGVATRTTLIHPLEERSVGSQTGRARL